MKNEDSKKPNGLINLFKIKIVLELFNIKILNVTIKIFEYFKYFVHYDLESPRLLNLNLIKFK